jgi:hypothetical protein
MSTVLEGNRCISEATYCEFSSRVALFGYGSRVCFTSK